MHECQNKVIVKDTKYPDTDYLSSEEVDVTQWLSKSVELFGYRQLPYIHSTTSTR